MPYAFNVLSRVDTVQNLFLYGLPFATTYDTTEAIWVAATVAGLPEIINSIDYRTTYADQESEELPFLQNVSPASAFTSKVTRHQADLDNLNAAASMTYGYTQDRLDAYALTFNGSGEVTGITRRLKRLYLRRWPTTVNGRNVGLTVAVPPGDLNARIDEDVYGYGTAGKALAMGRQVNSMPPIPLHLSTLAHPSMDRIAPEPDLFGLLSGTARHRSGVGADPMRMFVSRPSSVPLTADNSGNYWRVGETVELWSQCPPLFPTQGFTASRQGYLQPFWGLPPAVWTGFYHQWGRFPGDPAPVCELRIFLEQQLHDGTMLSTQVHSEILTLYPVVGYGPDMYGFGGMFTTATVGTMHADCTGFRYRADVLVDGTTGPSDDEPFKPDTSNVGAWHRVPPHVPFGGCSGQGNDEAGPIPGLIFRRYPPA